MSRETIEAKLDSLEILRSLSFKIICEKLGIFWKEDPDFLPEKNMSTKRVYLSGRNMIFEMLITDKKWFDTRTKKGGGGAIDFVMYIMKIDFVKAVYFLKSLDT